jgi:hypothetical protein
MNNDNTTTAGTRTQQTVLIGDIDMKFGSMVSFITKWALATLVVVAMGALATGAMMLLFGAVFMAFSH